jgi:hypothetical protein
MAQAVRVRRRAAVVERHRGRAAVGEIEVEGDVLADEELPSLRSVLLEPALDRDPLEAGDRLGNLAEDRVALPVELERLAEAAIRPSRAADFAVEGLAAGVPGDRALALVEVVEEQRVVVGIEGLESGGRWRGGTASWRRGQEQEEREAGSAHGAGSERGLRLVARQGLGEDELEGSDRVGVGRAAGHESPAQGASVPHSDASSGIGAWPGHGGPRRGQGWLWRGTSASDVWIE